MLKSHGLKKRAPVYYADYLGLERLLSAQNPLSRIDGRPAHDEMLFIVTHQAYELWFKQILHELDSVLEDFSGRSVAESRIGAAVARLARVVEIQKLLVEQLHVLETMTPLDFLSFRDALTPASGFQSFQFRLIEQKLGLPDQRRVPFEKTPYFKRLSSAHRRLVLSAVMLRALQRTEAPLETLFFMLTETAPAGLELAGATR